MSFGMQSSHSVLSERYRVCPFVCMYPPYSDSDLVQKLPTPHEPWVGFLLFAWLLNFGGGVPPHTHHTLPLTWSGFLFSGPPPNFSLTLPPPDVTFFQAQMSAILFCAGQEKVLDAHAEKCSTITNLLDPRHAWTSAAHHTPPSSSHYIPPAYQACDSQPNYWEAGGF